MVDLIIPVYNNRKGLMRSLLSVGMDNKDLFITIIDDASTETYDDIIKMFEHVCYIQYIRLNENQGPGIARNIGLAHTKEPYVIFLDAGDTFTAPGFIQHQMGIAQQMPDCVLFSWAHNDLKMDDSSDYVPPIHNRLHGKVYKRDFLDQYGIRFNKNCSYYNEDVGFNWICRIIVDFLSETNPNIIYYYENNESAVNWTYEENSISRKNNHEFYFNQSSYAFAVNMEYTINIVKQAGIPDRYMLKAIYCGMAFLYMSYLETIQMHPEYSDTALTGAVYYYDKVFSKYGEQDLNLVKDTYYDTLSEYLADQTNYIRRTLIPFDYANFLNVCEDAMKNNKVDYSLMQLKPC